MEEAKSKANYSNESQQTLIKVVEYLAMDVLEPRALKDIQEGLGISKDTAFRTIWNLKDLGWVEESAIIGGYRLSPQMINIADRLRLAIGDLIRKYQGNYKEEVSNG
ncbi:MAG: hypothetical protein HQK98_06880 [Nitrospirae bacterium]|nr:hypothetical protein [Nitrospirota bacterium]